MLSEFLDSRRTEILARCRVSVQKAATRALPGAVEHGLSPILDQVIGTLRSMRDTGTDSDRASPRGRFVGAALQESLASAAAAHGLKMRRDGCTMRQLVRQYEDLDRAVTYCTDEMRTPISIDERYTFQRCLDAAVMDGVAGWSRNLPLSAAQDAECRSGGRVGQLAHELRNSLSTAMLAFSAIKSGSVGIGGATAGALDRSHDELRQSIDRALADIRYVEGLQRPRVQLELDWLIAEIKIACGSDAQAKGCRLEVAPVPPGLAIRADKQLLYSAVSSLLHSAFKFTRPGSRVLLSAYAHGDMVSIEVQDECGGLPPGKADSLLLPITDRVDRSALGLGLSICRRAVEACDGTLRWRDIPLVGCVFTIDLPRQPASMRSLEAEA